MLPVQRFAKGARRVACALGVVVALCSCTSKAAPSSPPTTSSSAPRPTGAHYQQILQLAKSDISTDFERQILADDVVSRAEYEEMFSTFSSCMNSAGYKVDLTADTYGRYTYSTDGKAGVTEADGRCAKGTINPLAALYHDFATNPSGDDPNILRVACLKRHGVVPESYPVEQFTTEMADPSSTVVTPGNPEVAKCITDPNG